MLRFHLARKNSRINITDIGDDTGRRFRDERFNVFNLRGISIIRLKYKKCNTIWINSFIICFRNYKLLGQGLVR